MVLVMKVSIGTSRLSDFQRLLLGLVIIAICALAFRVILENSGRMLTQVYLERYYSGTMSRLMAEKPFWYFLLPMPDIKGVWATTGFVAIYFLEISIGPHATFLCLVALMIFGFGIGCWLLFRQVTPSLIGAGAIAFSPFNDSVYLWNGSNNAYVTIAFLMLSVGCFGSYVLDGSRRRSLLYGALCLVIAALSYEIWLNAVAILLIVAPFIVLFAKRWRPEFNVRRFLVVNATVVALAFIYVFLRMQTLRNTAIPGFEFQLIWDHQVYGALFDDFSYNVVFLFYMTILQFLPRFVGTSLVIQGAGRLDPAALQHGYQPDLYPLVASHYLHLWLMYAGIAFGVAAVLTALVLRKSLSNGAIGLFLSGMFGLALLVGSPTHAILKFVAFNGVPFYAYKTSIGVAVGCLGLATFVSRLDDRQPAWRWTVITGLVVWLGVVAFTRSHWINENVLEIWGESGFFANGFYPDPWQNLLKYLGFR